MPHVGVTSIGETWTVSSEGVTPPSSLLRTHAPIPSPLPDFGLGLARGVFAGCHQPLLLTGPSRRYFYQSFLGCLSPYPGGFAECTCLVLPQPHRPSPVEKWVGFPLLSREHDFSRTLFRSCSYFVMFKPPSLFASQVVPTAAGSLAGQPRLLRPSRTCVVTFARIGYAIGPTTGNWPSEDFHLARFVVLSTAPLSPGVHLRFC